MIHQPRQVHAAHHDYLPGFGHDRMHPFYDSLTKLLGVPKLHRALINMAGLNAGQRVLEIGCGTGNLSLLVKRLHPAVEVVGIDPDALAIARAKRKAGDSTAVEFDHGYGQELPYPDASFDRVLSAFMFHHLDSDVKGRTLEETLRVLKPGGTLTLADFGGRVSRSDGFMARRQLRSSRLRDNLGDGIPSRMRDAGFSGVTELANRVGWIGRITYYRGTAPVA